MLRRSLRLPGPVTAAMMLLMAIGAGTSLSFGSLISRPFLPFLAPIVRQSRGTVWHKRSIPGPSTKDNLRAHTGFAPRFILEQQLESPSAAEPPLNDMPDIGEVAGSQYGRSGPGGTTDGSSTSNDAVEGTTGAFLSQVLPQSNRAAEMLQNCPRCDNPAAARAAADLTNLNDLFGHLPSHRDYSACDQCGFDGALGPATIGTQSDPVGPKAASPQPVPEAPTWILLATGALLLARVKAYRMRSHRRE